MLGAGVFVFNWLVNQFENLEKLGLEKLEVSIGELFELVQEMLLELSKLF